MEEELRPCKRFSSLLLAEQTMQRLLADGAAFSTPVSRRSANYQPSLWDDNYIQSLPDGSLDATQVNLWEKLKEEVRHLIDQNKQNDTIELLEYVNTLCQLGISYHFESEIKNVLTFIASSMESLSNILKNSLHGSALLFRLLREYGIKALNTREDFLVRSFKNENGSFKVHIVNDVKGMLSLYEASYLSVEGEDDLDEAMEFTTKHLSNYLKEPSLIHPSLVEQISHALHLPLHWRMPTLHTMWFIDTYEKQENTNYSLFEFAKLDFNMVQSIYKKEVKEMSSWWRSIGLAGDEFSFARDRLMENYFWAMGCALEPHFWRCRKEITKLVSIITTIDDIYDTYGSIEELVLFTNAVDEWKIIEIQSLPNCMRKALLTLINTMNEIAFAFSKEKGLDILPQLKRPWGYQCKAYLVEAIWYNTRYIPTLNEYMENAWLSIGTALVLTVAYLLSEDLTKEALNSLELYFDVTRYSCMITRLYDDLGTSKDELQRGDVPKSIQCYMNETNVLEFVARDHIRQLIKKYWKLLNGEYFSNFNLEESFKRYALNLPRMTQCIYEYGDGYGKPDHETWDRILSSLIKPIPL
ncbi:terpene synthase 10 [Dendrobium catenatum]|uniref:Myrcene synthase, chloroplastic n=2 Tax=Dendrobium TaxID=37818 RepID=A0A2I0WHX5_9ASPA|nr:terpene synthase 10 [Dendrobium catenatum]PKU75265.1 Myrcene synthase, chloroplastic [Dendrobium catenatum]QNQ74216.1 chloroplast geraniol synthase [Dendrobium officinale]